jgi:hypothetical protein
MQTQGELHRPESTQLNEPYLLLLAQCCCCLLSCLLQAVLHLFNQGRFELQALCQIGSANCTQRK